MIPERKLMRALIMVLTAGLGLFFLSLLPGRAPRFLDIRFKPPRSTHPRSDFERNLDIFSHTNHINQTLPLSILREEFEALFWPALYGDQAPPTAHERYSPDRIQDAARRYVALLAIPDSNATATQQQVERFLALIAKLPVRTQLLLSDPSQQPRWPEHHLTHTYQQAQRILSPLTSPPPSYKAPTMSPPSLLEHNADSLSRIAQSFDLLRREISRVYVGPIAVVEALMIALLARGHVLIEGVPGVAKTTLVKAFSQTLDCAFRRIQFTPDLLPSDITGTYILDRKAGDFILRQGPVFANIVLGDEINRAPAKTQSALLEAMQEEQVTIEGQTLPLPRPFLVLATQNPVEQEGVYLLPEAQLDRFMFKMHMGYPSLPDELHMLRMYATPPAPLQALLHPQDIIAWSALAEQVTVRPELFDYIVKLVRFTREHKQVALGASPRASIALMRGARARALIQGRDYVLPDDIRALAPLVIPHRVILQPEAEMSGQRSEQIVQSALASVRYAAP